MTRQVALERSELVRRRWPLLHQAVRLVGHPQIRTRGTVGGSVAHADPAAELPVALTALGARFHLRSPGGARVAGRVGALPRPALHRPRAGRAARGDRGAGAARGRGQRLRGARAHPRRLRDGGRRGGGRSGRHAGIALLGAGPVPARAEAAERALAGRRRAARGGGARPRRTSRASTGGRSARSWRAARSRRRWREDQRRDQRARLRGRRRAAHAPVGLHPARRRADRHEGRLRAGRLRRLHRPARRRGGALVPDARGPGERPRAPDRRGALRRRRRCTRSSAPSTRRTRFSAASARPAS